MALIGKSIHTELVSVGLLADDVQMSPWSWDQSLYFTESDRACGRGRRYCFPEEDDGWPF